MEDQKLILDTLDLRDLVNQLYDASIRTSLLMSTRCSLTQFVLMQWSSGAIDHRLQCFVVIILLLNFLLLSIVSLSRLASTSSIDRINSI